MILLLGVLLDFEAVWLRLSHSPSNVVPLIPDPSADPEHLVLVPHFHYVEFALCIAVTAKIVPVQELQEFVLRRVFLRVLPVPLEPVVAVAIQIRRFSSPPLFSQQVSLEHCNQQGIPVRRFRLVCA